MKSDTQLRGVLVISILSLLTLSFFYTKQNDELIKYQKENKSLTEINDSLEVEIFMIRNELGKLEMSIDEINETPKYKGVQKSIMEGTLKME